MHKGIWIASCLLLTVAPCARAANININITEGSPDTITVNLTGSTSAKTEQLGKTGAWTIDTFTDFGSSGQFFFQNGTTGTSYFQEPDPHFLNSVAVTGDRTLTVMSDIDFTGKTIPQFTLNGKMTDNPIGFDTNGNKVFVTFNDSLTPDPADMTPEPASFLLVGFGVLWAIQGARSRKAGNTPVA